MKFLLTLGIIILLASPALANGVCPAALSTVQSAPDAPPAFTVQSTTEPSSFRNVTFFDGPPAEQASIAPESDDGVRSTWTFDPAAPKGIWVACGYQGTQITLQQQLDRGVRKCVVAFDRNVLIDGYPQIRDIDCLK